tara:strand:+ start:10439 stop:11194 length:756 start_codon:yes stop_codon:yes gene_type:complete
MEISVEKLGGIGASECGKLFTSQGLKAKTALTLAYEKALELINGYRKNITTAAMQHGIFSEEEAYYTVVKPFYPNSKYQSSESIWITDLTWATPDVVDDVMGITIDIKCPYSPFTFWGNVRKLPDTYISQNQMQMIGTGHKKGAICLYLTSTNIDEWGNKIEFEIPLEERHLFLPIDADEVYQNEILKRIDEFFPIRDTIYSHLIKAPELNDMEFFQKCKDSKVTRFKDKSNLLTWENKIIKNGNEYYTVE